jgi:hypothetical protein
MLSIFWLGDLKGRDHSEDLGREEKIIMDFREIVWEGVDLMHLAHDRDQWQVLICTVVKLWVL